MNQESLELLLRQKLSTIKEFVSSMFDSMKKEIKELKDGNNELKRNLSFTQTELEEVRKVVREQGGKLNQVTNMYDLSERLRKQEDYSRRQNVVIEGLTESEDEREEKLQVSVQALLKDKMPQCRPY